MELDIEAKEYIVPKEPIMSRNNKGEFFYSFTYPKTKQQIKEEEEYYMDLLIKKQIKQIPPIKNYINGYIKSNSGHIKIVTEFEEEYKQQNIRYNITPRDKTISMDTIKNIITKQLNDEIDINLIHEEIKEQIKKYVYLEHEAQYDIISIYIIIQYVYLELDFIPIIHIVGEAGTGKSQLGKIMTKLSLNSSATISATKSSFFRRIDKKRGLYFMDEKEHLHEYEKELLNGCTYEGSIHTVTEKVGENLIDTDFNIYTPVVIACINDIYGATGTRAIRIETTKPPREHNKYEVIKLTEEKEEWKRIRDKLMIYWLKHNNEIKDLMNTQDQEMNKIVSNRGIDTWKSIINMADKLGIKNVILEYIKNYYIEQIEDIQTGNIDLMFLMYLYRLKDDSWVQAEDIYYEFCSENLTEKQNAYFTKTKFGKLMKQLGYTQLNNNKKRKNNGFIYNIDKRLIENYIIKHYDFGEKLIQQEKEIEPENIINDEMMA